MQLSDALNHLRRLARPTRDVVIVSFPKAGRTWLRFMLGSADINVAYDHAGSHHRFARRFEEIVGEPLRYARKRLVFLSRDPRDTVVSGFFQASRRRKQRFDGDIHAFIRDPRHGIEKIVRFNLLWLESRSIFRDFLHLRYEDLHADPIGRLGHVIGFIERRPTAPRRVAAAVEAGRFENMRRVELESGRSRAHRLGPGDPSDPESYKTRKGVVGGWRSYLSAEDALFAEEILARHDYWSRMGTN